MPTPNPRLEPFVGYRVTLAPDTGASRRGARWLVYDDSTQKEIV